MNKINFFTKLSTQKTQMALRSPSLRNPQLLSQDSSLSMSFTGAQAATTPKDWDTVTYLSKDPAAICDQTGGESKNSEPAPAPSLPPLHPLPPLPTLYGRMKEYLPVTLSSVPGPNTLWAQPYPTHCLKSFYRNLLLGAPGWLSG